MSRLSVIPAAALDDVAEKRMTLTHLRVLCGLGTCTNKHGWATDTNQQKIARKAGLARETVNRALNKLEELGWVEVYESRNQYAQLAGLLCYRVVLDPPYGPEGERLESPTYKRRRAHIPSSQEREADHVGQVNDDAESDSQADASDLSGDLADLQGSEGLDDTPCDRDVTGGGVIETSQGGCDYCGHRGCDYCDHNRVDSFIDKSSMRTSARRMVRGERVTGVWFNPDIQLATALHDAKAKQDVTRQLNELLGSAEAATHSAKMDVRAYIERGFVRWNMIFAMHADAQALRDRLRGLGKGVVDASGSRVQICTEAHWARLTAEITMPYNPPVGELGQLFDQAIECGRSETDLAPCCEDGFVLIPDPDFKWAVRSTGMSSREVGRVFIGAIKALGWNPEIKPLPLVERHVPATETAHG
ncbi:helix-turn-helix domain-containing protein [Maricaulis maris]|uniref:MarR family protein n=1 Tax=Maricaulis maris TaxID=74318 RepID=A0A495D1J9_9PROT|nr:helix-turn-helix domain-containing protein [Maricaulis maris]RKQ95435.1 MarR family protein [Maricaulis maris]